MEAAERDWNRARGSNWASLAWAARPDLVAAPGVGSRQRVPVNVGGDFAQLGAFRSVHEVALRDAAARRRADARAELDAALGGLTPITTAAWADWFTKNHGDFVQRMRSATEQRRKLRHRTVADPALPSGDPLLDRRGARHVAIARG